MAIVFDPLTGQLINIPTASAPDYILNNSQSLQGKRVSGVPASLIGIDGANTILVGDSTLISSVQGTTVNASAGVGALNLFGQTGVTLAANSALITVQGNGTISPAFLIQDKTFAKSVTIGIPDNVTTTYRITLPGLQGTTNTTLVNDGTGVLSWQPVGANTTLSNLTAPTSINQDLRFGLQNSQVFTRDLIAGDGITSSGNLLVRTGTGTNNAQQSGLMTLSTGYADGALSGPISVVTGDGNNATGNISVTTGIGRTSSGNIAITTGGSTGAGSTAGNIILTAGSSPTLQGSATINAFNTSITNRIVTGASHVSTAITAAQTGTVVINARTNRTVVVNLAVAGQINLPAGENGLELQLTAGITGANSYAVVPNGADTLAFNVLANIMSATSFQTIKFNAGVWYRVG